MLLVGSGLMSACDKKEKHWQNTPSMMLLARDKGRGCKATKGMSLLQMLG
jgi:hypothetical protein